jgi:hypothetical protein
MATISRGLSREFGRTAERAAGARSAASGKRQAANNVLACWAVKCFLKDFDAIARLKKKPRD